MGEFFHGWRRRIGLVTLMVACVFTAGWVRSLGACDQIHCSVFPSETLQSTISQIRWWSGQTPKNPNRYFLHWVTFKGHKETWAVLELQI